MTIVAFTGHRPQDTKGEQHVRDVFRNNLDPSTISVVITGMAAGVDLWAADEARELGIEIWCAKPWTGHTPRSGDERLYERIIQASSKVVDVDDGNDYPGPWIYQERNMWMVDHATHLMAYWSGKERGGTYNCIQYAKKVGVPIRNVY